MPDPGLYLLDVFAGVATQGTSNPDAQSMLSTDITFQAVPEPSSFAIFGIGFGILFARRRNSGTK